MAIHITVVGFGREPDLSVKARLEYCGFLEASEGKIIKGNCEFYTVKTQYPDAVELVHIVVQDEKIDCRDMALVFDMPFDGLTQDTPEATARAELMGLILAETAGRCGALELVREVEGLFETPDGLMAYVFKNVSSAIEDDIANGVRRQIREIN